MLYITKKKISVSFLVDIFVVSFLIFTIIVGITSFRSIFGFDFDAFRCAGLVTFHGQNPYLYGPIHTCEASVNSLFFKQNPHVAVPSPLPPYSIPLFYVFALLPADISRFCWSIVLIGCIYLFSKSMAQLSGQKFLFCLALCGPSMLGITIFQGGFAPIPLTLLVSAAVFFQVNRWDTGAFLLSLSMMEPHVGLPACLASFLFLPKSRKIISISGFVFLIIGIKTVGINIFVDYFKEILPIHASAEIHNLGQQSLSAILYRLGVPVDIALHIGFIQYIIFILIGIFVAHKFFTLDKNPAWYIIVPSAFSVVGGEFIHLPQMAMIMPLACMMLSRYPTKFMRTITFLILVPFEAISSLYSLALNWSSALIILRNYRVSNVIIISILTTLAICLSLAAFFVPVHHDNINPVMHMSNEIASISWREFLLNGHTQPIWWFAKATAIIPPLCLLTFTFIQSFKQIPILSANPIILNSQEIMAK